MGLESFLNKSLAGRVLLEVFNWYPSHLPQAERSLLRKLDRSILVFACLSFFCKFLDQSNITNAWVSGMEEEIHAKPNDLNYYNVAYYTAYVVGQIPMLMVQSRPSIAPYWLPSLEIVWAVLTFCESRVQTSTHLYIIRALVGFFEAPSFAGTHFILGSWYKKEELYKRAGVWFMGNSLGSMFSGYLQAAAYTNLNGVHGLSGWRWLFIIDGVITLPIAAIGFTFFPGLPASKRPWYMTEEEHQLAKDRLPKDHKQAGPLNLDVVKRTLSKPLWYICVAIYVGLIQSSYWTGYMALWLKAEAPRYTVQMINILPTFVNLLAAASSWLGTTFAAIVPTWIMMTGANGLVLFATIVLTVWHVPDGLKFFAFYIGGGVGAGMISPILYSWVNVTARGDPEARALIMGSMMTAGYCTYIWVPLFTFPTVEAPTFPHGYPASIGFTVGLWAFLMLGIFMYRNKNHDGSDNRLVRDEEATSSEVDSITKEDSSSPSHLVSEKHHHGIPVGDIVPLGKEDVFGAEAAGTASNI
ncbi:major facilitator superfamily transporter [Calocera cornea HHB12733]|uniref:Major facilitator superfamily transporter n=1 Tax=Calocera cornea HHB12733 TaxID=1353952 RepID=A0A165DUA8_9BASI|nr:major facilitator superfamily transporter [Calocera cornea HHB12733]